MLDVQFDETHGIAILEPHGALSESDFDLAAEKVDPFIETHGKLQGVIIYTESFPGWKDFGAMISHFKFVKAHQSDVKRVAIVTDSIIGDLAEHIASHFISATIKHFAYADLEDAKHWISE